MTVLSEKTVLERLAAVEGLKPGSIAGVSIAGGKVSVALSVDPAKAREMEAVRKAAEDALRKISGVTVAMVALTAEKNPPPSQQQKKQPRPVAPEARHIIAVASGKGGVGKSTVSANLALALAAMGKSVGLLDADIYGASQPRMMGYRQNPKTDDAEMIVPPVVNGIKMMSMGFFVEETSPVIWRGPMVHAAIQQLLRDVAWGELDALVIDLPPGTGDAQLSLVQNVPLSGAIIVSTPQDVALSEAKKGLLMFQKVNVPVLGIVENMSYHICANCGHREEIFNHGGARRAAVDLGVPFLGEIPLRADIRAASDAGTAPADAEIFSNIAARVWTTLPAEKTPPRGVRP